MPCFEIRTQSVEMSVARLDILAAALSADGATSVAMNSQTGIVKGYYGSVFVKWQNGVLTVEGNAPSGLVNQIKRAYTAQAFKVAAKRMGFQVKPNQKGQLVATRRTY